MFRLVIALAVAYMLLPANDGSFERQLPRVVAAESTEPSQVSAFDGVAAAQEIYSDISQFCTRNEKTCETAKNLALKIDAFLGEKLQQYADPSPDMKAAKPDQVTTSSIN